MTEEWDGPERRSQAAIGLKLDMLHDDVTDMKAVLKDLTTAINRLAIVEERQTQTATALERAFGVISKVEERLSTVERQIATIRQANDWVGKVIWATVAATATFIAKKVGLV